MWQGANGQARQRGSVKKARPNGQGPAQGARPQMPAQGARSKNARCVLFLMHKLGEVGAIFFF